MPWLISDFAQQRSMPTFMQFAPKDEGANVVLLSRQGVPLVAGRAGDTQSVRTFCDQAAEVLWQIDPTNPVGWPDRLYYVNATRPAEFAHGHGDPVLVGNPLRAEALRRYGVKHVAARLAVAPDGKVTPVLLSGPDDVPPNLVAPLNSALSQAVVYPAIDQGKPVAGSLDYVLEMPPADPTREANEAWLASSSYPVLPLADWLVLRPIQVSEQDFLSDVESVDANGTVVLKAMEVNSSKVSHAAQISAFNSNWFDAAGADSVRPKEGDRQKIDEHTTLTWEKVSSKDGYVDMQTGIPKDYTVGYAWTEFTVPAATEALLGLGSDDGVKVWLNGQLIHDKWIRRISRVDDDALKLHLKKGPNRILIKIQNVTGDWSFRYRLRVPPR